MTNEIKEILDRLERIDHKEYIAFEFADSATFDEVTRCFKERKKLADYITNLQEEIERQSKAQVILDNQIAEMYDYKSRNEKAIEYINNYIEVEDAPINERIKTEFKEVIRLLTGGDE